MMTLLKKNLLFSLATGLTLIHFLCLLFRLPLISTGTLIPTLVSWFVVVLWTKSTFPLDSQAPLGNQLQLIFNDRLQYKKSYIRNVSEVILLSLLILSALCDIAFSLSLPLRLIIIETAIILVTIGICFPKCLINNKRELETLLPELEYKEPQLHNTLTTAYELLTDKITTSPLIRKLHMEQSSKLILTTYTPELAKGQGRKKYRFCRVLFYLLIIAIFATFPRFSMLEAGRLFIPFLPISPLAGIQIEAPPHVAKGDPAEITLTSSYIWPGRKPELLIRYPSGKIDKVKLNGNHQQWRWKCSKVTNNLSYRVNWLWQSHAWQTIRAIEFPALQSQQLLVEYPAYTFKKPTPFKNFKQLDLLRGSKVKLSFSTNKSTPQDFVRVTSRNDSTPQLVDLPTTFNREKQTFDSQKQLITESCTLEIALKNSAGYQNQMPYIYHLEAVNDKMPYIQTPLKDGEARRAAINEKIMLHFTLSDDFGIRDAVLHTENIITGATTKTPIAKADKQTDHFYETTFIPTELGIKPGDKLLYYVTAGDYCPDHQGSKSMSNAFTIFYTKPIKKQQVKPDKKKQQKNSEKKKKEKKEKKSKEEIILENAIGWQMKQNSKMKRELFKQGAKEPATKQQPNKQTKTLSREQRNLTNNLKTAEKALKAMAPKAGKPFELAMKYSQQAEKKLAIGNLTDGLKDGRDTLKLLIESMKHLQQQRQRSSRGLSNMTNVDEGDDEGNPLNMKQFNPGNGRGQFDDPPVKETNIDNGLEIPDSQKAAARKRIILKKKVKAAIKSRSCPPEFRRQVMDYFETVRQLEQDTQPNPRKANGK